MARAVTLVEDRLRPNRPPALSCWARHYAAGRVDRFLMRCYTSSARSYRRQLVEVALIPAWRERAALSAPDRAPTGLPAGAGWTRREHLRRGVRKLVR